VEHVARIGRRRVAYRVWLEILRERDLLEDRRRLKADKNVNLKELRWGFVDWTDLVEDRGK
jgi:hypothetical protein